MRNVEENKTSLSKEELKAPEDRTSVAIIEEIIEQISHTVCNRYLHGDSCSRFDLCRCQIIIVVEKALQKGKEITETKIDPYTKEFIVYQKCTQCNETLTIFKIDDQFCCYRCHNKLLRKESSKIAELEEKLNKENQMSLKLARENEQFHKLINENYIRMAELEKTIATGTKTMHLWMEKRQQERKQLADEIDNSGYYKCPYNHIPKKKWEHCGSCKLQVIIKNLRGEE